MSSRMSPSTASNSSTRPYVVNLSTRGYLQGVTYLTDDKPRCHYFGGIPFTLPCVGDLRWKRPLPLGATYSYGTKDRPGDFSGKAGVCPQPGSNSSETTEDCLQLNIWIPGEKPPEEGWPVFFYIHGGFLQLGSANESDPIALITETPVRAIIVSPGYRLNIFGFLASPDLISAGCDPNCGFWDQRLALEWTYQNITFFCGNASNITISGYSAGAHSVFHQLAFDLYQPPAQQLIKRAIMWSNGPALQPRSLSSAQEQFDELLSFLEIPWWLSPTEKLDRLKALSPADLLVPVNQVQSKSIGHRHLIYHQYRAVTDGLFVRKSLFSDINTGAFARRLKSRNVKLMIGECRDEHYMYAIWHPPSSFHTLYQRLLADYPEAGVHSIMKHYCPDGRLPPGFKTWQDLFGHIYADIQIYLTQRGFLNQLASHGAGDLLYRYRVEWRAKCVSLPPEWGVTHSSDLTSIWFFGDNRTLDEEDGRVAKMAFLNVLAGFVRGREIRKEWGTNAPTEMRRLRADKNVDVWVDDRWGEGLRLWEELTKAGAVGTTFRAKL